MLRFKQKYSLMFGTGNAGNRISDLKIVLAVCLIRWLRKKKLSTSFFYCPGVPCRLPPCIINHKYYLRRRFAERSRLLLPVIHPITLCVWLRFAFCDMAQITFQTLVFFHQILQWRFARWLFINSQSIYDDVSLHMNVACWIVCRQYRTISQSFTSIVCHTTSNENYLINHFIFIGMNVSHA